MDYCRYIKALLNSYLGAITVGTVGGIDLEVLFLLETVPFPRTEIVEVLWRLLAQMWWDVFGLGRKMFNLGRGKSKINLDLGPSSLKSTWTYMVLNCFLLGCRSV